MSSNSHPSATTNETRHSYEGLGLQNERLFKKSNFGSYTSTKTLETSMKSIMQIEADVIFSMRIGK